MSKLNNRSAAAWAVMVLALSLGSISEAQADSEELVIHGPRFAILIRGSGGWVCSAQDKFDKLPYLGRGDSKSEASSRALNLAKKHSSHKGMFVEQLTCEESRSSYGSVSVTVGDTEIKLVSDGTRQVRCTAEDHFDKVPFVAEADSETEARAMASRACTLSTRNKGFFCEATCDRIPVTESGSAEVRAGDTEITVKGIKIPLPFPLPFGR